MRPNNAPASLALAPLEGSLTLDLLHALADRSERDRRRLYIAEGLRVLHCAIAGEAEIAGLAICRELLHSGKGRHLARGLKDQGVPTLHLTKPQFVELTRAPDPQGILLVLRQSWRELPWKVNRNDLWLAVERVRSPGNLGTLLRSAHAAGAKGLMVLGPPRDRADPFDPASVRASMGSLFALDLIATNHQSIRKWQNRYQVRIVGADGGAATDYRRLDYRKPTILMLGQERVGLSEAQQNTCDCFARIPMAPGVDSLNIAMAGTLFLFEALRCRR